MKQDKYELIVGNIGTVYSGNNKADALGKFSLYKGQSIGNYGRAAGENVTLMRDGEPWMEYFGTQENPGLRAQVRRLPTGEIQLKIPLTRNPASLKQAMKAVKKLGRRVKSVVVTGMKRAKRNPLEPGLSPTWYRKGQAAGRNTKWKDMYDAWHWVKGKPTISGKRVTAQESFFQGWFDATQRP